MSTTFHTLITGAGVVGLAVGRRLSLAGYGGATAIVEKEDSFGKGVSSRNSEVIHSGIYYPTGSLKHRLCIDGRREMYDYCAARGISHRKCGKLIVATYPDEAAALTHVYEQALRNGVEGVHRLTQAEALSLEPNIIMHEAVFSGETGIVCAHDLMRSFEYDARENDATIAYRSEVTGISYDGKLYTVFLADGDTVAARVVINCGGLYATAISAMLGLSPRMLYPCKGVYFSAIGKHHNGHLVYPVPQKNLVGLGVHATIDLDGRLKFGPDAEYIDSIDDFSVDQGKGDAFFTAASRIFRTLKRDQMFPDMAGIRPKIQGPNDDCVADFHIVDESAAGFPGFINLLGIESPGLTASLAIGDYVYELTERYR